MKKIKGFTLVELVITIAIVIILSVVSVPIYRGYVDKAKWSEAYSLMGTCLSAQKSYYSEYGNFLRTQESSGNYYTCNEVVLGIDARGNKYFTWFEVGGIHNDPKYLLWISVKKPEDFGVGSFVMWYNITTGSTFLDYK